MKTIETKVYEYDELSDEAKEKARAWWREGNDYPFLNEEMRERAGELLEGAGIEYGDMQVYYSLGYCQGDGAMVEFLGGWKTWSVKVKQAGRYSHERSTSITLTDKETGEYAPDDVVKHFEEDVYIPLCIELKKYGYSIIEAEDEDENVAEALRANEYTFTEDGKRFG